jgi:uncharacterized membrane protein
MLAFKFLHIVSMFASVTLAFGGVVFLDQIARRRDIEAYRRLDAIVQRTDAVATALFAAGIAFGVLAALTGGFDLTASWLILAYVLVGGILIDGFVFFDPWLRRLRAIAHGPDTQAAVEELHRLVRTR